MLLKGLEVGIEMCIVDNQNEISVKRVGTHIIEENKNSLMYLLCLLLK